MLEVYAEMACPFTHVGLQRLVVRRNQLGLDDVAIRIFPWPLELVNGEPLQAALVQVEIDALREQVAADLFAGFDARRFPATSLPAMALAEAAYRSGTGLGEIVSIALRSALFEHGRDIAQPEVLDSIAAAHGVPAPDDSDHRAVLDAFERGKERGVVGSPHFFAGTHSEFCPALEISHREGRFDVAGTTQRLDELLRAAVAA